MNASMMNERIAISIQALVRIVMSMGIEDQPRKIGTSPRKNNAVKMDSGIYPTNKDGTISADLPIGFDILNTLTSHPAVSPVSAFPRGRPRRPRNPRLPPMKPK